MDRGTRVIETTSAEATIAFGKKLAREVAVKTNGVIICLFGELGAGKTTLIKGIVSELSPTDPAEVCSPTFSYLNIYEGAAQPVYHFDLYRLSCVDEFLSLGLEEYLFSSGVCCLEWSERIAPILPQMVYKVFLSHAGEDKRKIYYEISEC